MKDCPLDPIVDLIAVVAVLLGVFLLGVYVGGASLHSEPCPDGYGTAAYLDPDTGEFAMWCEPMEGK